MFWGPRIDEHLERIEGRSPRNIFQLPGCSFGFQSCVSTVWLGMAVRKSPGKHMPGRRTLILLFRGRWFSLGPQIDGPLEGIESRSPRNIFQLPGCSFSFQPCVPICGCFAKTAPYGRADETAKCEHMFPILLLCDRGVPHPRSKINRRGESIIQSNGQIISAIGPKRTQTLQMNRRASISAPGARVSPNATTAKPGASTHFPLVDH